MGAIVTQLEPNDYLPIKDFAKEANIAEMTAYRAIKEGTVRYIKAGGALRVYKGDLDRWRWRGCKVPKALPTDKREQYALAQLRYLEQKARKLELQNLATERQTMRTKDCNLLLHTLSLESKEAVKGLANAIKHSLRLHGIKLDSITTKAISTQTDKHLERLASKVRAVEQAITNYYNRLEQKLLASLGYKAPIKRKGRRAL